MAAPGDAIAAGRRTSTARPAPRRCSSPIRPTRSAARSGMRIVAFALRAGRNDVAVAVEDFPSGAGTPRDRRAGLRRERAAGRARRSELRWRSGIATWSATATASPDSATRRSRSELHARRSQRPAVDASGGEFLDPTGDRLQRRFRLRSHPDRRPAQGRAGRRRPCRRAPPSRAAQDRPR